MLPLAEHWHQPLSKGWVCPPATEGSPRATPDLPKVTTLFALHHNAAAPSFISCALFLKL